MAELRSFIFIDQMQPQTLCYMATWMRGRLPRTNMAAQIIEVAPGLDIERLTDVALKIRRGGRRHPRGRAAVRLSRVPFALDWACEGRGAGGSWIRSMPTRARR
jgi:hypothetical protein